MLTDMCVTKLGSKSKNLKSRTLKLALPKVSQRISMKRSRKSQYHSLNGLKSKRNMSKQEKCSDKNKQIMTFILRKFTSLNYIEINPKKLRSLELEEAMPTI